MTNNGVNKIHLIGSKTICNFVSPAWPFCLERSLGIDWEMAATMVKQLAIALTVGVYNLILNYIKSSYQNDPFRVFLEGFLFLFAAWYLGTRAYKPNVEVIKLSKKVQQAI
jgi:hypothetical protein